MKKYNQAFPIDEKGLFLGVKNKQMMYWYWQERGYGPFGNISDMYVLADDGRYYICFP